ncbi:hypothetical protein E1283_08880 [Streptomyces hainanensis]|uniref:Uncharacterized protein n=1 Tax=Streptomyces hainanensis TaxID=402648 RepID=A0A4R4TJZ6_9ACTN|nr:hypothetical protein E1283_08880 [Streptomyces hainanensis]
MSRWFSARGSAPLTACAVHFTDPSGHHPVGQDGTGIAAPESDTSENSWSGANTLGQPATR